MTQRKGGWNEEQLERIEKWLNEKWGVRPCPYCHAFDWTIVEPGALPVGTPEGQTLLGPSFPCIVVACRNCGHLAMVSAYQSGVIEPPKGEEGGNG